MSKIDDMMSQINKPAETEKELRERLDAITKEKEALETAKQQTPPAPKTKKKFQFKKEKQTEAEIAETKALIDKVKEGAGKLTRREKRMIENREFEGTRTRNNLFIAFAIIGLFFIMFLYTYMKMDWMFIIIILLGSFMFLPVGMLLGWAFLDPYVRCKVIRKVTRRNYGIVNFVGKGQKLISKIKNFEQALVWKKNEVWIITEEFVYQLSKDGDSIVEQGRLAPENIVTLIDTVPVLFIDVDSMQPLSLARDRREGINPLELGSTLKAWVDNQLAKAMFLKKSYNAYFLIIIIACIGAIGFGYVNYTKLEELSTSVKTLSSQIETLVNQMIPPT